MIANESVALGTESGLPTNAGASGGTALEHALDSLERGLPLPPMSPEFKRQVGIAMLERWAKEADEMSEEELKSNEEVFRAIDSHRPHRKLFDVT